MDITIPEKKKKKSRKEKKEEDEVETVVIDSEKKKKKEKKKKHIESPAEDTVITEVSSIVGNKEKKKKKRKEAESTEGDADSSKEIESRKKVKSIHTSSASAGNYVIHPEVAIMSSNAVDNLRQEMDMVVIPEDAAEIYKPMTSFAQLYPSLDNYCPEVRRYIDSKGFTKPSPIQVYFESCVLP